MTYFFTQNGIKVPVLSKEQMIEVDRIAMEETGPNLWQMMENAGRNLSELIIQHLDKGWKEKEIFVLAGKGNNGGGGICAARHLLNHGANVKLILADKENLDEVPNFQKNIYESAGGKSFTIKEAANFEPDIIIDAIIGYNLKGKPRGILEEMIIWANSKNAKIVSLDIPSGFDSNTGQTPGEYINAFATLTLALPKTGLMNNRIGRLFLCDIGIPKSTYSKINIDYVTPFNSDFIIELFLS